MSFLILALPVDAYTDQALDFVLLADGEVVEAGRAAAGQLPTFRNREHEVVALAPLAALSWHPVQLPPGLNAGSPRLRAVLDGLLEDQLLDATGDLHLALAEGGQGDWVAACERRWLAMAVQGLEAAGCRLSRVLPEWGPPTQPRLHVTGTPEALDMVLCTPSGIGQLPLAPSTLALAGLHGGEVGGLRLSAEPELQAAAQAALGADVEAWPRSQRWAAAALPRWDLARGLLMRKRAQRSPLEWLRAPRWRAARWATLGLLGVNLLGVNALAWAHSVQLQARREQMRQALLQSFPQLEAQAVTDPPGQMQREIDRLRAGSSQATPGDLPALLSAALPALPPGRTPQALVYRPGELQLGGLQLSPAEQQAALARLRPLGYLTQQQGADWLLKVAP